MGNKSKQFPDIDETGQIISEVIKSGKSADIVVESDSFAEGLVEERDSTKKLFGKIPFKTPYIRVLRFILIMTALVMSVTFILHYSIVYIRDVLFYKTELKANSMGALTPRTGTGTEYGVFLFNTAELWSDSGIRISKGDEVSISMSGSFHSSIADLKDDAENNNSSPGFGWIHISKKDNTSKDRIARGIQQVTRWLGISENDQTNSDPSKANPKYYLYNQWYQRKIESKKDSNRNRTTKQKTDEENPMPGFGAALCAIAPEYFSGDPLDPMLDIHILNGKPFKAKSSGVLRFAVNDVVLNDDIIWQMIGEKAQTKDTLEKYKQEADLLRKEFLEFRNDSTKNSSLEKFQELFGDNFPANAFGFSKNENGEIEIFSHYIERPYKDGFQPWYDDNVGQLLACVEIRHPLKMEYLNPMSAYRKMDKAVREFADESFPNNILPFCYCILVFLGFVLWIMLICATWTIIAFAIITAVYWIAIAIGKGVGRLKAISVH